MSKIFLFKDRNHPILDNVLYEVLELTKDDVIDFQGENFEAAIARTQPSVIVPIGEKNLVKLGFSGIMKNSGKVLEYNGVPVVPVMSPAFVEKNTSKLQDFAEHLNIAYQISQGVIIEAPTTQIVEITSIPELWRFVEYAHDSKYFSFDFETTKLKDKGVYDPGFALIALSMSFQQGSSYVIVFSDWEQEGFNTMVRILNDELFGNPGITKIGHYVKFDMHCASIMGITSFRGCFHCTMIMSHLLDENTSNRLKDCVRTYIPRFANYEEKTRGFNWKKISRDDLVEYVALDADLTLRLYWLFTEMLMKDERLYNHYRNIDSPATKSLFKMEKRGMQVDKIHLGLSINDAKEKIEELKSQMVKYEAVNKFTYYVQEDLRKEYITKLEEKIKKQEGKKQTKVVINNISRWEEEIRDLKTGKRAVDYEVNFSSPKQLVELLYSKKGFNLTPHEDWTGKKHLSTDKKILEFVVDKSGFIDDLIQLRQMEKILSTYLLGIYDKLDDENKIHTSFSQHVTKTGRLCIEENQLVTVVGGVKPIKDIQIGDLVYCYNNDNKLTIRKVLNKWDKGIHDLVNIKWQSSNRKIGSLICTPDHYILTKYRGWVQAKDLKREKVYSLHRSNSSNHLILSVKRYNKGRVYDIEVEDYNNFIASEICVHNSSQNPNLQNIITRTKFKKVESIVKNVKKSFVPPEGYDIYQWDYSQAELRLIAFYSQDKTMLEAYRKGEDIHSLTAATVMEMPLEEFKKLDDKTKKTKRFEAKAANFGLCLHEDTKINTKRGILTIPEVVEGDYVLTHRGNWKEVVDTQKLKSDVLYEIETVTGKIIKCTPEHMMLSTFPQANGLPSRRGWVEAQDIEVGMYLTKAHPDKINNFRKWSCEEKVKSVKIINHDDYVYDITVKDDHSFVANNLYSHNCYGMSAFGFQNYARTDYGIKLSKKQSETYRNNFFKKYSALPAYHKSYISKARKFGQVRTFFGRAVRIPDIYSPVKSKLKHAENNAVNSPIQGTAGEMTIFALGLLENRLPDNEDILMVNTVHDSIIFYIKKGMFDTYAPIIKETMSNLPLKEYFNKEISDVQMVVDVEFSEKSWGELKEI